MTPRQAQAPPLSPAALAARAAQQRRARIAAALTADIEAALATFQPAAAAPRRAAARPGRYRGTRGAGTGRRRRDGAG
jgi:hypothetical protein